MARRSKSSNFIQGAIKRPGALTKRKKSGESTNQAARRISNSSSASPLAKKQANFYLNVLKPANSGGSSVGRKKARSHAVKSHKRTLPSGKVVRVKRHRRSKKGA